MSIESVLTCSISLWHENSNTSDRKALRRVVRTAERTIVTLPPIEDLVQKCLLAKVISILRDSTHPYNKLFSLLPSGRRYSFYLAAIRLLNKITNH